MRRTVARRAEHSRSDFVCPGMSGRDWCGGPWHAGPSVRGRTLFFRAMSVSYGVLSSSRMGRFRRIYCQRRAKVAGNFVKRSNELSEQSEERLAAQRKRAAVKVSNKFSKGRKELLRAKRERAAAKQAQTTSLPTLRGKPASLI